jgi:hypothetical protein
MVAGVDVSSEFDLGFDWGRLRVTDHARTARGSHAPRPDSSKRELWNSCPLSIYGGDPMSVVQKPTVSPFILASSDGLFFQQTRSN